MRQEVNQWQTARLQPGKTIIQLRSIKMNEYKTFIFEYLLFFVFVLISYFVHTGNKKNRNNKTNEQIRWQDETINNLICHSKYIFWINHKLVLDWVFVHIYIYIHMNWALSISIYIFIIIIYVTQRKSNNYYYRSEIETIHHRFHTEDVEKKTNHFISSNICYHSASYHKCIYIIHIDTYEKYHQ